MQRLPNSPRRRTRTPARPQVELMERRLLPTTINVTGTGDSIATDGVVTLREAITAANTNAASGDAPAGTLGLDTIDFAIPGSGVQTITLLSALPSITDKVSIDGTTQPGSSANTVAVGDNAVLNVEIDGGNIVQNFAGLQLNAGGSGSTIRGLVINRFVAPGSAAIQLFNSNGNTLVGNFLGTNAAGNSQAGQLHWNRCSWWRQRDRHFRPRRSQPSFGEC